MKNGKQLDRYSIYAKELLEISLVQKGTFTNLKIDWRRGKEVSYSSYLPPEEEIIVLMHKIRPFILKKEQTHFNKIINILSKKIKDNEFLKLIKLEKDIFSGKNMRESFEFILNKEIINSEKILIKWLNAYEYHKDEDKQAELERMHKIIPLEFTRGVIIMMLQEKIKAILNLSGFVNVILSRQNEMKVCKDEKLTKWFNFKINKPN